MTKTKEAETRGLNEQDYVDELARAEVDRRKAAGDVPPNDAFISAVYAGVSIDVTTSSTVFAFAIPKDILEPIQKAQEEEERPPEPIVDPEAAPQARSYAEREDSKRGEATAEKRSNLIDEINKSDNKNSDNKSRK